MAPPAAAHNKVSIIQVSAAAGPNVVRLQAIVTYVDGDPVTGEDVVGVLFAPDAPASRRSQPLTLHAVAHRPGVYATDITPGTGRYAVKVAAVTLTRGEQTVSFVRTSAGVEQVKSPAAVTLPSTAQLPTTVRGRLGTALRLLLVIVVAAAAALGYRFHRTRTPTRSH